MTADGTNTKTIKRPQTPSWSVWKQRPNCSLANAVAISINLNPWVLPTLKEKRSAKYRNYLARLKTASLSTYPDGPINEVKDHPESLDDPYYRIISLASFVDYAAKQETWRKKLPLEFLLLGSMQPPETDPAKSKPPEPSGQVSVNLPHMTKILDALFQVMREQWDNFDPDRPPKQMLVAHAIDKALGNKAQKNGDASRNGQALSAAMRPDHLRESDRRASKQGL